MKANWIYIVLEKKKRQNVHEKAGITSQLRIFLDRVFPWCSFCCLLNVPAGFPVIVTLFAYIVFFGDLYVKQYETSI